MKETDLNTNAIVLWFDDLGSGNEEHRFLSNFYEAEPLTLPDLTWEGLFKACGVVPSGHPFFRAVNGPVKFLTGEHAFAAMKFWGTDRTHFREIVMSGSPGEAKSLGRSRKHPLRADWEVVKLDVMAAVIRSKFTLDREEGHRLLDTGDRILVEGTFWGDTVWGVDLNSKDASGRNWLGTLLMARRAELRAQQAFKSSSNAQHFSRSTVVFNTLFSMGW